MKKGIGPHYLRAIWEDMNESCILGKRSQQATPYYRGGKDHRLLECGASHYYYSSMQWEFRSPPFLYNGKYSHRLIRIDSANWIIIEMKGETLLLLIEELCMNNKDDKGYFLLFRVHAQMLFLCKCYQAGGSLLFHSYLADWDGFATDGWKMPMDIESISYLLPSAKRNRCGGLQHYLEETRFASLYNKLSIHAY